MERLRLVLRVSKRRSLTTLIITLNWDLPSVSTTVAIRWWTYGEGVPTLRANAWAEDSLQCVFSSTKGATAICAHLLAQRGELDLDAPVVQYWPEFGAAGKENIPVRYLLSHRVGLPWIPPLTPEESFSWEAPIRALEAQHPAWEPGTAHGYHPGTYGWLVGEVIHRVSGKTPGTFFAEEVAGPLDLEFWIGLPEREEHRVTRVESIDPRFDPMGDPESMTEAQRNMIAASQVPDSLLTLAMSILPPETDPNSRAFRAHEQPAGNGITTARSLARMYASSDREGVDGIRILDEQIVNVPPLSRLQVWTWLWRCQHVSG